MSSLQDRMGAKRRVTPRISAVRIETDDHRGTKSTIFIRDLNCTSVRLDRANLTAAARRLSATAGSA
jgi:hypothetical protein